MDLAAPGNPDGRSVSPSPTPHPRRGDRDVAPRSPCDPQRCRQDQGAPTSPRMRCPDHRDRLRQPRQCQL